MSQTEVLEIVTNNPRLTESFSVSHGVSAIHNVEGSPLEVLARAEELLQSGYRLISAPLPPNIPLMRAPYRSLILARAEKRYDVEGLHALCKARDCMATQRDIDEDAGPGRSEDFALIDEDLLARTLKEHEMGLAFDRELAERGDLPVR